MAEQDLKNLNIYQKLAKIRKQVEVIQKNKAGYGYKYVSEDEILARISTFMDKYSLSLIPSITKDTLSKPRNIELLIIMTDSQFVVNKIATWSKAISLFIERD